MELDQVGSETFESEISEDIENENKKCFLPHKEKLKFHSVILMEIFNFEDFNNIINGLKRLYANSNELDRLSIEKVEQRLKNDVKLFQWWSLPLPPIHNSRINVKIPFGVSHDLGMNINEININLYGILSSMVIMQIHININFKFSNKINSVLYKLHNESITTTRTEFINLNKRISPKEFKEYEIKELRYSIKEQSIKFLSDYFKGYFFKLYKNKPSVVPNIDIFSLTSPIEDEDMIKWEKYMNDFFQCFSVNISSDNSFKFGRYLLTREKYSETEFNNYLIYANREYPECPEFNDFDSSIENYLTNCSFELVALDRLMDLQKNVAGKFNEMISNEISYIEKDKFEKAINNRKSLNSEIFSFERFKLEFKQYMKNEFHTNKFNFVSLTGNKEFFKDLNEIITFKINEIDNSIKIFNKHSNSILKLKNIEYAKKNQDKVLFLSIIVVILTLVQIYLAYKSGSLVGKV